MENKVSIEVAEAEFERFAEAMDIDIDLRDMDEDDVKSFLAQKRKIINAICRGSLVINDNGEAVYTPWRPASKHKDPLTFHERTGGTFMAAEKGGKKDGDFRRMLTCMADMCGVHPNVIYGLSGTDIKTCEAIFAFLVA